MCQGPGGGEKGNGVAQRLARYEKWLSQCAYWFEEPPAYLLSAFSNDVIQ